MKKPILICVLSCMYFNILFAQDWVSFTKTNPEEPIINVIHSDYHEVEFTLEVSGMFSKNITEKGITFRRINIPGAGKSDKTGEPELPYIRQMIAIPECEDVMLNVNITRLTRFINYNIYPAPDYEEVQDPNGATYLQEVFSMNRRAYEIDIFQPGMNAEIVSTGYLRGQKYAEVHFYPIQFNPVSKELHVYTNFEVQLNFVNPSTDVNVNIGIFNKVATNTFINYTLVETSKVFEVVGNVYWPTITTTMAQYVDADYLIICDEHFYDKDNYDTEVYRIASHRAQFNGFDVAIVNAKRIYDELDFDYEKEEYKEEQKLRTFIKEVYNGYYSGKLKYVLLIGDTQKEENVGMPTSFDPDPGADAYEGDPYPSDYYYSCLTQVFESISFPSGDTIWKYDPVGDIFIGRFCVDNNLENGLTELHNIINKTILYEKEYSFESWKNNLAFTNVKIGEEINYGEENPEEDYYDDYYDYIVNEVLEGQNMDVVNSFKPAVYGMFSEPTLEMLNNGAFLMTYHGHGAPNAWVDLETSTGLDIEDFELGLTIENVYPFCNSITCNTGWFDWPFLDCMAEALTTYSENKGFVGFLGSGRIAMMDNNINELTTSIQALLPYYIFQESMHITGEFILAAKLNANLSEHRFAFNLFGDPALNLMAKGYEITQNTIVTNNKTVNSEVIIREGVTLQLEENVQILIGNNGKLVLEDGATIECLDGSKLTIDNSGIMDYQGGSIILAGSNALLDIKGTLHIAGGKTFTFSAGGSSPLSGSVKLDGNIVADPDASIIITGNSINDEVIRVGNKTINLPENLHLFKVTYGKIVMEGGNSQLKTFGSGTDVYLNNFKLTSSSGTKNYHNGIYLFHTTNATIINSVFENGMYGLRSVKSGSEPNLLLTNCTFTNCTYGLLTTGRGLQASNCTFIDNYYGWEANLMVSNSNLINSNLFGNKFGIRFQGSSTSHLLIEQSVIDGYKVNNYDGYYGIYIDGPLTLELKCSEIINHKNAGTYLKGNSSIDLSPSSSKSNLSNNKYAIYANLGNMLYLNYGYNSLKPNTSLAGYKTIFGNFVGMYGTYYCNYNEWNNNGSAPVAGVDYALLGVTLKDKFPLSFYFPCSNKVSVELSDLGEDAFDPTGEGLDVRKINTQHFRNQKLNKAVAYVYYLIQSDNSDAELNTLLLSEILLHPYKNMNSKEQWYIEYAYNMFKENVGAIDLANNTNIYNKAIHVQNKLYDEYDSENVSNKEYKKALFGVGKAHFHYLAGRPDKAIAIMEKTLNHITDTALTNFIQEQICYLNAEIAIAENMLEQEELDTYLENCFLNKTNNKSGSTIFNKMKKNEDNDFFSELQTVKLAIYPNPITGISQIKVNIEKGKNGIIKIYNIQGKIIQQYSLRAGENMISISKSVLQNGIYNVVLYENDSKTANQKIIVN